MIAAGGTGGHFFPAEALAGELIARGHRVALHDGRPRGAAKLPPELRRRRGPSHPARRRHRRPRPAAPPVAGGDRAGRAARCRHAPLLARLGSPPLRSSGSAAIPSIPPVMATRLPPTPRRSSCMSRTPCSGRANRAMASRYRQAILALSFAATAVRGPHRHGVTGNPAPRRPAVAADAPTHVPPSPDGPIHLLVTGGSLGRPHLQRRPSPQAMAALPPMTNASASAIVQQCRRRGYRPGRRQAYAASGIAAELSTFFPDVPARPRRLPSRDRPRRRIHGGGARRIAGRPADPGALPVRHRRPPDRQRRALREAAAPGS